MKKLTLQNKLMDVITMNFDHISQGHKILNNIEEDCKFYGYEYELFRITMIYYLNEEYDQAFKVAKNALDLAYSNSNPFIIREASFVLATHNVNKDNLDEAAKLFISIIDKENNIRALNNLGDIYLELNDTDEALYYFDKANNIFNGMKNPSSYNKQIGCTISVNLAEVYLSLFNAYKAIIFCEKADKIASELNYNKIFAYTNEIRGHIEVGKANYDEALFYFNKSKNIYINHCYLENRTLINKYYNLNLINISNCYYLLKNY